jgi:MFS superfamily sulfate permease-like transporter
MPHGTTPAAARPQLSRDLLSSIVVFFVALPLCMGVALASGAPIATGLITGLVGGLVVGGFSGSPLMVSGPTPANTVIVVALVERLGLGMLGLAVIIAGFFQLAAGALRLGPWFRAVSPAVVKGMLAGIGILIFASQFHVMVDDKPHGTGLENLLSIPQAVWKGIGVNAAHSVGNALRVEGEPPQLRAHHLAARLGVLTIAVILLWQKFASKKLKLLPGPLVAIVVATAVAATMDLPVLRVQLPANIAEDIRLPRFETIQSAPWGELLVGGLMIAAVASAETMLSATALDQLKPGMRTNYDRELKAQGFGNVVCGFIGALPVTGVIVRSSTNVHAGAQTRLSTMLHGVWLGLAAIAFGGLLQMIPTASLAAVLVFTGYKLVKFQDFRSLLAVDWREAAIYAATMTTIVVENLLTGVLVGIALAALKLLESFSRLKVRLESGGDNRYALHLAGAATFVRLPRLAAALEQVPGGAELHVELDRLTYIDHACMELLHSWEEQHRTNGGSLTLDWDSLRAVFRQEGRADATPPDAEAA